MGDEGTIGLIDPGRKKSASEWLDALEDLALDRGEFEPLGPDHSAVFVDEGPMLLVTFETIEGARSRTDDDVPLGWTLASPNNWSQLCILSQGETWFRHRAVYGYFDRLVDEGFFDNFDQVVFYGAESCGYAAAAFSVVAPGATVITLSPQATLDPRLTEWDERFDFMRRTSFTDRYGFAPDMLDAAARAHVFYDPAIDEDAMHAALFARPNVQRIRCRNFGGHLEPFFRRTETLAPLIEAAMAGKLTSRLIYRLLRERRGYLPYLRQMLDAAERRERPFLTGLMCRSILRRINTPRFRRQLTIAEKRLAKAGRALPAQREQVPA